MVSFKKRRGRKMLNILYKLLYRKIMIKRKRKKKNKKINIFRLVKLPVDLHLPRGKVKIFAKVRFLIKIIQLI